MEKNNSFRHEGNQVIHTRVFNAPRDLVWEVWTKPEHLKEWWGPDGFTLTSKSMDLREGHQWKFIMHGADRDWDNKIEYIEVVKPSLLVYRHGDENDTISFMVHVSFEDMGEKTFMTLRSVFKSAEFLAEMDRKVNAIEGGKQHVAKLEMYINSQVNLRKQLKTTNAARVSTYLNFAGNTEEAFNFYKSVFGGQFAGEGIKRFGDIPQSPGAPAINNEDKKLILHVELPILGGHILMGTDAPESMGFHLTFGNNVHINLEPDNREETKRLFDALSAGGKVTMDLQDMFWGAYYGSCSDKYGVQWMFNCNTK